MILFEGISKSFGIGEKRKINGIDTINLDPKNSMINFPGAISFETHNSGCYFSLWKRVPEENDHEEMREPSLILRIWALEQYNGSYAGDKHLISEQIVFQTGSPRSSQSNLSLEDVSLEFCSFCPL